MGNLRVRGKARLTIEPPHIVYGEGAPSRGEQLKKWTESVYQCAFAAYPQVLTKISVSYDRDCRATVEFLVEESAAPKQVREYAVKTASDMYLGAGTSLADQRAKDADVSEGHVHYQRPVRVTVKWIDYEIC